MVTGSVGMDLKVNELWAHPSRDSFSVLQNLHLDSIGSVGRQNVCGLAVLVRTWVALGIWGQEVEERGPGLVTLPPTSFLSFCRTLTSVDPFYRDVPHSNRYPTSS